MKRSSLAEFSWVVADWMARQPGCSFDFANIGRFFGKDLHEHWRSHLWKMRIRVADTTATMVHHLNARLEAALVKAKNVALGIAPKGDRRYSNSFCSE